MGRKDYLWLASIYVASIIAAILVIRIEKNGLLGVVIVYTALAAGIGLLTWKSLDLFIAVRNSNRIANPPGAHLSGVAYFLFSNRDFERIFKEIAADMQEEHFAALANKELWRAQWIVIRGNAAMIIAASSLIVANCLSPVIKAYSDIRKIID